MTSSIVNVRTKSPFLRTSRDFPTESQALSVENSKTYIDIANAVNSRTIGIFPINRPVVTGERWSVFFSRGQQTLRQVYTFTAVGSIQHNIPANDINAFTRIYGTFTNGTNWYPLPYVDTVSASNQVNIYVSPTNIVITAGAGSPPAIVSGLVILEWMANP